MQIQSHIRNMVLCAVGIVMLLCNQGFSSQKIHTVFFEGEENELHVYRINGTNPGKTLLIVGGIQGDEPGGYLAADYYVDLMLEKGNLIVIPRANFPSILKKERQINQDMNRKFLDDHISNYETRVVTVLKKIICESDCFLNLHEGSGFFSSEWESQDRNPERFGQSIIVDDLVLKKKESRETIQLGEMAMDVIEKVNLQIKEKRHYFHISNHKTGHSDSTHKEQLRSATYFAYDTCKIPAFGIESSKLLPLEQKVKQQIYAINGFMENLDIIPKSPGIDLKKPEMEYMIISVNDSIPVVVGKMQRLKILKGDVIQVLDMVANYERGLSVDVIGLGNQFNDMRHKLIISESTRIEAKKDSYKCGSIFLDIDPKNSKVMKRLIVSESKASDAITYKLIINGNPLTVDNYTHVKIHRGDKLVIEDIITGKIDPSKYVVNFKGFVGNRQNNSGEDRGYVIDTSRGILMKKYSLKKKGSYYYIRTTLDDKEVGKVFIDIQ